MAKINRHIKATRKHLEKRARDFVREKLGLRAGFVEPGIGSTTGLGDVWAAIGYDGLSCWLELKASSHWKWRAKQRRFAIQCDLHGIPYFLLFNDIGGILKWHENGARNPESVDKNNLHYPFVLIKPHWKATNEYPGVRRYQQPPKLVFLERMSKDDDLHEILKREIS